MSFSDDIGKFQDEAIKETEEVARRASFKLFRAIINDTPVDTGTLRGNWQTSAESPKLNRLKKRSASVAISEALSGSNSLSDEKPIYFTNNLEYAERIEYGYSRVKSPQGMVRKNLSNVKRYINQSIKEVGNV